MSYDLEEAAYKCLDDKLKGHQIIGELRLMMSAATVTDIKLKGHQIIGELRLNGRIAPPNSD